MGMLFMVGGDWSVPATSIQVDTFFKLSWYAWSPSNLLGVRQAYLTFLPMRAFFKILALLGIQRYDISLLAFTLLFAFVSMLFFLRALSFYKMPALIGSLLYITTPVFYNFTLMGWLNVLLVLGLFPLIAHFFIKSVQKRSLLYSILVGFLFAVAVVQSQALIWVPIVILALAVFLISDKSSLYFYLRSFFTVIVLMLLLHASWWPTLLSVSDPAISGSSLLLKGNSVGTSIRLSFVNLLRLWGGLFNYQYETSYSDVLGFLSFIPPAFALLCLIFKVRLRLVISLIFIALVPVVLFITPRTLLAQLPYSNFMRDFARFTVLSTFAFCTISVAFIDALYKKACHLQHERLFILACLVVFILYSHPFWNGSFWGYQKKEYDFRFREFDIPFGYVGVESYLAADHTDVRTLFLPLGGSLQFVNDIEFRGAHKNIRDVWASFSPKRGIFGFSGRESLPGDIIIQGLWDAILQENNIVTLRLLRFLGIKYLVIRHQTWPYLQTLNTFETLLAHDAAVTELLDFPSISLYSLQDVLPHVYVAKEYIVSNISSFDSPRHLTNALTFSTSTTPAVFSLNVLDTSFEKPFTFLITASLDDPPIVHSFSRDSSWTWPEATISPGAYKYFLVRLRERFDSYKFKTPLERADFLMWLAAKRVTELSTYALSTSTRQHVFDDFLQYSAELSRIMMAYPENKRTSTYWESVERAFIYLSESMAVLYDNGYDSTEFNDYFSDISTFFEWFRYETSFYCDGGCYKVTPTVSGVYDVFVGNNIPVDNRVLAGTKVLVQFKEKVVDDWGVLYDGTWDPSDGFQKIGTVDFEEGVSYMANVSLPDLPNLVASGDWLATRRSEVSDTALDLSFQSFLAEDTQVSRYKSIETWQGNRQYKISFDYTIRDGSGTFSVIEDVLDIQRSYRSLSSKWPLIFDITDFPTIKKAALTKILHKKLPLASGHCVSVENDACFLHFEETVSANNLATNAYLLFSATSEKGASSDLKIRNLKVTQIPELALVFKKVVAESSTVTETVPQITFTRVNPTRYKVRVIGATKPYALVFNERFHDAWQIYSTATSPKCDLPAEHRGFSILGGLGKKVVANFFGSRKIPPKATISYLGGDVTELVSEDRFLDATTFTSWGDTPIAEDRHYLVNGFANAWTILPSDVCNSQDYELLIEFWPQRFVYIGTALSILTTLSVLVLVGLKLVYYVRLKYVSKNNL